MSFKTYQTEYGFITIDTDTETPPVDYIAEFDVTPDDATLIQQGADIIVNDTNITVVAQALEGEIL